MDLNLKTKTVADTPVWLDTTETLRMLVGGVTIDSASATLPAADADGRVIVKSGTPIVKVGSGKWEPAFALATDVPTAILWESLDVTDGDVHGSAMDHGRVRTARLPVTVHATVIGVLNARGITFRP